MYPMFFCDISYNNNMEYREVLRNMFSMDVTQKLMSLREQYPDFDEFEEETRDELLFDQDAVELGMNHIYEKTRSSPEFMELYLTAAGLMISENPEIGLAVLMSYDYLILFNRILIVFFSSCSLKTCDAWIELQRKLGVLPKENS